jgi:enoyl-[acyl-carrier protein] reductase II
VGLQPRSRSVQAANVGTRFLASTEARIEDGWKRRIVEIEAEDAVRFETWSAIMPPSPPGAYDGVPRVIRTDFVTEWETRAEDAAAEAERLQAEIMGSLSEGRTHQVVAFTGQTAGLIDDVRPAGELVRELATGAERALEQALQARAPD